MTSAGARPRTAQKRTSADPSSAELEQARHRGRIARPEKRPRRAPARFGVSGRGPSNNRRQILARRESADREKRLADDRRGSGASGAAARYCASAVRAAGVRILPSACAASRATAGGVVLPISNSDSHGTASGSFNWPVANATVATISTSSSLRADNEKSPPGRVDDAPDGHDRAPPDLRMRRRQQTSTAPPHRTAACPRASPAA